MGIITIGIDQNGPFVSSLLHKELTMTPEEKQIMEIYNKYKDQYDVYFDNH